MSDTNFEIELGVAGAPERYTDALLRAHNGLERAGDKLVGTACVSAEMLAQDIEFTIVNNLPAENTASRLETYTPNNESQQQLLDATNFVAQASGRFMGVFAMGAAGVGKSHLAIGLAKKLALEGQETAYIHVPSATYDAPEVTPDQTMIIDDLNGPFGWGRQNFAKIITAMHHNGSGRLFITSNIGAEEYEKFIVNMVDGMSESADVERIRDRMGAAIKPIHVTGFSHRTSTAEDPWADFN